MRTRLTCPPNRRAMWHRWLSTYELFVGEIENDAHRYYHHSRDSRRGRESVRRLDPPEDSRHAVMRLGPLHPPRGGGRPLLFRCEALGGDQGLSNLMGCAAQPWAHSCDATIRQPWRRSDPGVIDACRALRFTRTVTPPSGPRRPPAAPADSLPPAPPLRATSRSPPA